MTTAEGAAKLIDELAEMAFYERLSNQQLVMYCLSSPAAQYAVVCEMMSRLYPGWETKCN